MYGWWRGQRIFVSLERILISQMVVEFLPLTFVLGTSWKPETPPKLGTFCFAYFTWTYDHLYVKAQQVHYITWERNRLHGKHEVTGSQDILQRQGCVVSVLCRHFSGTLKNTVPNKASLDLVSFLWDWEFPSTHKGNSRCLCMCIHVPGAQIHRSLGFSAGMGLGILCKALCCTLTLHNSYINSLPCWIIIPILLKKRKKVKEKKRKKQTKERKERLKLKIVKQVAVSLRATGQAGIPI